MAKAELKTKATGESVEGFLNGVADERQREDSFAVLEIMRRLSGHEPRMWGPAIIGFGDRHLIYDSGRELEWTEIAFSPRKGNLTLYVMCGSENTDDLLARLGKHKTSKACLYIKKLSDIDMGVLEELISDTLATVRKDGTKYPDR